MKLSRTVAYAVRATLQLAELEAHGPVPCSRLASEGKMPERFLLQILRNLVTHGILRSTRGVDGGYALIRPADQISLLEVIEAIDGPYDSGVEVGDGLSEDSRHKLTSALSQVTTTTRKQLEAIKLSALLPPPAEDAEIPA
ncbi:MAG: Rrf2 family transcriptional regulator [Pirellulaceae bacterium]|nr:Rrf2 family transcriptional regulator [Pirellulaceae bacterium]